MNMTAREYVVANDGRLLLPTIHSHAVQECLFNEIELGVEDEQSGAFPLC